MTAALMPQKMTLERCSGATREAASPTTMALSPASVTSIKMMLASAAQLFWYQSGETRLPSCAMASVSHSMDGFPEIDLVSQGTRSP